MKNSNTLFKLISKYALLLSLFYFIEIPISRLMREFGSDLFEDNRLLLAYIPLILTFVLNLITAVVLNGDGKVFNVRTNIAIIATLLFRPVGVVAFILFVMQSKGDSE